MIAMPEVAVGWYKAPLKMLHNDNFSSSFDAWQDMDKQLCLQLINRLFTIDPDIPLTYTAWNVHAWIPFSPNVPNLKHFSNRTGPFIPTHHTIPPMQTRATRQPLAMHLTKIAAPWKSQKANPMSGMQSVWTPCQCLLLNSPKQSRATIHLQVERQQTHIQQA